MPYIKDSGFRSFGIETANLEPFLNFLRERMLLFGGSSVSATTGMRGVGDCLGPELLAGSLFVIAPILAIRVWSFGISDFGVFGIQYMVVYFCPARLTCNPMSDH